MTRGVSDDEGEGEDEDEGEGEGEGEGEDARKGGVIEAALEGGCGAGLTRW